MDVTREADVVQLVTRAQQAFGGLDIMVCNAGFGYYGTVEEMDPDVMRRMMDVNFMGTFYGTRAALPVFRRQGRGHLIFVSSIVGKRGIPLMSGYSATKAAQAVFAESLRSEFAGTGHPRERRVSRVDDDGVPRRDGARLRPPRVGARPQAVQSTTSLARSCGASARPSAEVYPHRTSRGLAILNAIAPAFTDGLMRKYGRRRVVAPARGSYAIARAR